MVPNITIPMARLDAAFGTNLAGISAEWEPANGVWVLWVKLDLKEAGQPEFMHWAGDLDTAADLVLASWKAWRNENEWSAEQ